MNAFSSSKELLNEERKGGVINRDIPRLITPPLVLGVPPRSRGGGVFRTCPGPDPCSRDRPLGGQRSARSVFAPGWGEDIIYPRTKSTHEVFRRSGCPGVPPLGGGPRRWFLLGTSYGDLPPPLRRGSENSRNFHDSLCSSFMDSSNPMNAFRGSS